MLFAAPNRTDSKPLEQATLLMKALADETRLRILALLQNQELCACQIIELFDLANSTISKHLAILRQAGLIQARKQGRWIYFTRVTDPSAPVLATFDCLDSLLKQDATIERDRDKIDLILQIDPIDLCRRQNGRDCCP